MVTAALDAVLQVMFVLFAALGAVWGVTLYRARAQAHRIHYLMAVLVGAKTLTLLSQAGMYHLIRASGHPDGWNWAYYAFTFLRGLLFFTVRAPLNPARSPGGGPTATGAAEWN